jgi:hypothetical protein
LFACLLAGASFVSAAAPPVLTPAEVRSAPA